MPELAEVAYYSKQWAPGIGQCVSGIWINIAARCCRSLSQQTACRIFEGASLFKILTHGKRMLFAFSDNVWLEIHLGMTGRLYSRERGSDREKHDQLVLSLANKDLAFNDSRQFGKAKLHECPDVPDWWRALPPQPMDSAFTPELFASYCAGRKRKGLKSFLLHQEHFPGIGNWMADEILWQSAIDPRRLVGSLSSDEGLRVYQSIVDVSRGAMASIAIDYRNPPADWLFSRRWKPGGICPKTHEALARDTIGGRTTCWSPTWQN